MKLKLLYLSLGLCLFTGCDDFLDVQPIGKLIPKEVAEFENILNNPRTVEYYYVDNNRGTSLANLGDNMEISENMAEYLYTNTHPNIDRYAAYIFKKPYRNPNVNDYYWNWGTYRTAGLLNNVVDGIEGLQNKGNVEYANEVVAQAKAARAWGYLTMALVYGPMYNPASDNSQKTIPYRTSGDPTQPNPNLATTAEIFELVKADLDYALEHAPENVGNPSRTNMCAVQALAAYYYMFARDWENMLKYSNMAWQTALKQKGGVDNLIYNLGDFYYQPDPAVSPTPGTDAEVNLDLKGPDQLFEQTYHRELLFYRKAPAGTDYPSQDFLSLFDQENDLRYRLFALKALGYSKVVGTKKVNDGIVTKWYRGKKTIETEALSFPELLLMKAEANARLGKTKDALADLNLLRSYRYDRTKGTTDLENGSSMNNDELLTEIFKERRRELPMGTFQRVLDLKRLAIDSGKPWCKTTVVHTVGSKTYSAEVLSDYFILPISNVILEYNPQWGVELDNSPYNPKE